MLVLSLLCHQYAGQSFRTLQHVNNKAGIPKTDQPVRLAPLVNGTVGLAFLVPEVPREAGVASLIQDFADLTFQAFGHTKQAPQMYPQFYTAVPTLAGMGYRMSNISGICDDADPIFCYKLPGLGSEFRLALVSGGAGMDAVITDFNTTLAAWYPAFRFSDVLPAGSTLHSLLPDLPSIASYTVKFSSEAELEDYVKSGAYTSAAKPAVSSSRQLALLCPCVCC